MILGAETIGNGLTVTSDDARITRVGHWLRLWTLDEIPQLMNVFRGEMSIVGPRPWVPTQADYCSPADRRRFDAKPGMAGWAWIDGRNRLSWDARVRLDLFLWTIGPWDLISLFYRKLLCYCFAATVYTVQKPWAAIIIQKEQFRMNQKKLPVESKQDTAEVDVSGVLNHSR